MLKTVSAITNAIGALNYKGTWNASTNSPALASGVGTKGDYYVVSVAGSTSLDGISNWGVGDWVAFNGTAWQRIEGGADLNGVNLSVSGTGQVNGLFSLNTAASGLQTNRSMSFLTTGGCTQYVSHSTSDGSGDSYAEYGYNGTKIGSITQNGTTGVLYNITSDYRLKNVIGPVVGSGDRIDALQPVEYEWKSDGSRTRGFLAHDFQKVYAQSVTGEKDAVDEDGNPVYQNMQASTSEVIADLVAEIKDLRRRVAELESK